MEDARRKELVLVVDNPAGMHARPAAVFVRAATTFAADIRITNLTRDGSRTASGKSLLGVLGLGVTQGHEIRIKAVGEDASQAVAELAALVRGGLGEVPSP